MTETPADETRSPSDAPAQHYLGDGAYVTCDGWYLWLSADRDGITHRVALEPSGLIALVRYARQHGYDIPKG